MLHYINMTCCCTSSCDDVGIDVGCYYKGLIELDREGIAFFIVHLFDGTDLKCSQEEFAECFELIGIN